MDRARARSGTQCQGHLARPSFRSRLSKQLPSSEAFCAQTPRVTAAGEEAQVDYGSGPMVRDPQGGKYRRTRLFVLTLGYSRKSVRLLIWRSSSSIWAELHERAFRRLGGCPRLAVLDNLREGVIVRTSTIPLSTPCFAMCSHTTVSWPCLAGSKIPIAKGKWKPVSDTRKKRRSKDYTSRVWNKRRRIWIAGKNAGRTRASMARRNGKSRPCSPRKNHPAETAAGTVPLLPVWRTRGSSRRLCRGRSGLLRATTRMDRATRQSAMG
jgi:hypothetical protein